MKFVRTHFTAFIICGLVDNTMPTFSK